MSDEARMPSEMATLIEMMYDYDVMGLYGEYLYCYNYLFYFQPLDERLRVSGPVGG